MCLDSSGQSQAETFKLIFDEQPNSRVRASVWDFSPSSRGSVMKCLILSQFQTHHHHKSSLNIVKNNSLKVNVKLSTQLIVGTSVLRLSSSVHMRWRSVQSPVSCSSWFIGCHMYLLSCNVHASSWQRQFGSSGLWGLQTIFRLTPNHTFQSVHNPTDLRSDLFHTVISSCCDFVNSCYTEHKHIDLILLLCTCSSVNDWFQLWVVFIMDLNNEQVMGSGPKPVALSVRRLSVFTQTVLVSSFITANCWLDKRSRCSAVNTLCVFAARCLFTCWERTKATDVFHRHHCSVHQSKCQILRLVQQKSSRKESAPTSSEHGFNVRNGLQLLTDIVLLFVSYILCVSATDVRLRQVAVHLRSGQEETLPPAAAAFPGQQTGSGFFPEPNDQSHLETVAEETVHEKCGLWVTISFTFKVFKVWIVKIHMGTCLLDLCSLTDITTVFLLQVIRVIISWTQTYITPEHKVFFSECKGSLQTTGSKVWGRNNRVSSWL